MVLKKVTKKQRRTKPKINLREEKMENKDKEIKTGLENYYIWKEGYVNGINLVGNFLRVLKNIEDKKLRETIEMLQKEWSNYGDQQPRMEDKK